LRTQALQDIMSITNGVEKWQKDLW
jgi:hypothetical protein